MTETAKMTKIACAPRLSRYRATPSGLDGDTFHMWMVIGRWLKPLNAWADAIDQRRLEGEDHRRLCAHLGHEVKEHFFSFGSIQLLCLLAIDVIHRLVGEDLERTRGAEVLDCEVR